MATGGTLKALEVLFHIVPGPFRGAPHHVIHAVPGNADAVLDVLLPARVDLCPLLNHRLEALLGGHACEVGAGPGEEGIGREQNAFFAVEPMIGVPDLRNGLAGPADAPVDTVLFPEALRGLKPHLEELPAFGFGEGLHIVLREVMAQAQKEVGGNAVEDVIGLFRFPFAVFDIAHSDAPVRELDPLYPGVEMHRIAHVAHKAFDDMVHAPLSGKHGAGLIGAFIKVHGPAPEAGVHELGEIEGFVMLAVEHEAAALVAAPGGTRVKVTIVQVSEGFGELQ